MNIMNNQFFFILTLTCYLFNIIIATPLLNQSDSKQIDLQKSSLRVVNGVPVTHKNEYPFVVDLHMDEFAISSSRFCTGTLIAQDLVLTAAHCVLNVAAVRPVFATIGRIELQDDHQDNQKAKTYRTIASIAHPSYDGIGSPNDVALILLNATSTIPVVKLAQSSPDVNQEAWVVGYGIKAIGTLETTGRPIEVLSRRLQKTALKIMHNSFCDQPGSRIKTASGLLCTAGVKEGSSACKGDSGGGLFLHRTSQNTGRDNEKKNEMVTMQVGIVSYGDAQCASEDGGVFTDVSSVIDWIGAASSKLKKAFLPVPIAMDEQTTRKVVQEGQSDNSSTSNFELTSDSELQHNDQVKLYSLHTNFTQSKLLTISLCDGPSGYTARLFVASNNNETVPSDEASCPDHKLSTLTLSAEQNGFDIGVSGRSDVPFRFSFSTQPDQNMTQSSQGCEPNEPSEPTPPMPGNIPPDMIPKGLRRTPQEV